MTWDFRGYPRNFEGGFEGFIQDVFKSVIKIKGDLEMDLSGLVQIV